MPKPLNMKVYLDIKNDIFGENQEHVHLSVLLSFHFDISWQHRTNLSFILPRNVSKSNAYWQI